MNTEKQLTKDELIENLMKLEQKEQMTFLKRLPKQLMFWKSESVISEVEEILYAYCRKNNNKEKIEFFFNFLNDLVENDEASTEKVLDVLNRRNLISLMVSRLMEEEQMEVMKIYAKIFDLLETRLSEHTIDKAKKSYNRYLKEHPNNVNLPDPKYLRFNETISSIKRMYSYPANEARKFLISFAEKHYISTKDFFQEEVTEKALFIVGRLSPLNFKVDLKRLLAPSNVYKEHPYFPFMSKDKDGLIKEIKEVINTMSVKKYQKLLIEQEMMDKFKEMGEDFKSEAKNKEFVSHEILKAFDKKYKKDAAVVVKYLNRMKRETINVFGEEVVEKQALMLLNESFKDNEQHTVLNLQKIFSTQEEKIDEDLVMLEYIQYLSKEDKEKAASVLKEYIESLEEKKEQNVKKEELKNTLKALEKETKRKIS